MCHAFFVVFALRITNADAHAAMYVLLVEALYLHTPTPLVRLLNASTSYAGSRDIWAALDSGRGARMQSLFDRSRYADRHA